MFQRIFAIIAATLLALVRRHHRSVATALRQVRRILLRLHPLHHHLPMQKRLCGKACASRWSVNFDFDSAELTASAKSTLNRDGIFEREPRVDGGIEGHADERGTREYNLALGDRRATAAGITWCWWHCFNTCPYSVLRQRTPNCIRFRRRHGQKIVALQQF